MPESFTITCAIIQYTAVALFTNIFHISTKIFFFIFISIFSIFPPHNISSIFLFQYCSYFHTIFPLYFYFNIFYIPTQICLNCFQIQNTFLLKFPETIDSWNKILVKNTFTDPSFGNSSTNIYFGTSAVCEYIAYGNWKKIVCSQLRMVK